MFKRVILFQRGATSWGFQFGKYYFYILYPRYWVAKPHWPIRTGYSVKIWSGIKVEIND